MVGRKVTVFAAVAALFVSSIVGSTVLRDGSALGDATQQARDAIDRVRDTAVETTYNTATQLAEKATDPNLLPDTDATVAKGLGLNESLVLVIADRVSSGEAAAKLESINAPFGELQGLYADASDHYTLSGVYIQQSPDVVSVTCDEDTDCPDGVTTVERLQPVTLRLVRLDQYNDSSFPASCGSAGLPPCQRDRYHAVLGELPAILPGHAFVMSAFRTKLGAEQFVEFARSLGAVGLVTVQARKRGGGYVGLGQEPHPDGSGPLYGPLVGQEAYQQ